MDKAQYKKIKPDYTEHYKKGTFIAPSEIHRISGLNDVVAEVINMGVNNNDTEFITVKLNCIPRYKK